MLTTHLTANELRLFALGPLILCCWAITHIVAGTLMVVACKDRPLLLKMAKASIYIMFLAGLCGFIKMVEIAMDVAPALFESKFYGIVFSVSLPMVSYLIPALLTVFAFIGISPSKWEQYVQCMKSRGGMSPKENLWPERSKRTPRNDTQRHPSWSRGNAAGSREFTFSREPCESVMNAKPFSRHQKRVLRILLAMLLGGVASWVGIYFSAPEHERRNIFVLALVLACASCGGFLLLVYLYRRYPAPGEMDKKE